MTKQINPGVALVAMRRTFEHVCPFCGITYRAYATSKACKGCSQHARYLRWHAKKLNKTNEAGEPK